MIADPQITNCLFYENYATLGGAAILASNAKPAIANCTFVDNVSGVGGGAIHCPNGKPIVTNCIMRGNLPIEINGDDATVTYSNVKGGFEGEGNIDADPLFLDPEDLDFRIDNGSPCIDAGDNSALPYYATGDLDGNARFVDDPATGDTGQGAAPVVDMGSYEYQISDCLGDVTDDGEVDVLDLLAILAAWGATGDMPEDINDDGVVDLTDLLLVLAIWGPCE